MEIESVQVIPSRKDSLFDETPLNSFDCTITTSYEDWKSSIEKWLSAPFNNGNDVTQKSSEFDEVCETFAKSQKAYMKAQTAIFHDTVYVAKSVRLSSIDQLSALSNTGPLYNVFKEYIDDIDAGKIEERFYTDPNTFKPMHGMWYPYKAVYRLRYGVKTAK